MLYVKEKIKNTKSLPWICQYCMKTEQHDRIPQCCNTFCVCALYCAGHCQKSVILYRLGCPQCSLLCQGYGGVGHVSVEWMNEWMNKWVSDAVVVKCVWVLEESLGKLEKWRSVVWSPSATKKNCCENSPGKWIMHSFPSLNKAQECSSCTQLLCVHSRDVHHALSFSVSTTHELCIIHRVPPWAGHWEPVAMEFLAGPSQLYCL